LTQESCCPKAALSLPGPAQSGTRIVEENIDTPAERDGLLDHLLDIFFVGDVSARAKPMPDAPPVTTATCSR